MAEHQRVTPTVRPTRRERWVELGKDVLIVFLAVSALFLAGRTSMSTQLKGWMSSPPETVQPEAGRSSEAAMPYLLAVRNERGLYGTGYDGPLLADGWHRVSELLGRGLSTAGEPSGISEPHWRELLENPGVYCAFQGSFPLYILGNWLGEPGGPEGQGRELLLAWDAGTAWLAWRDENQYFAAPTEISWNREMSPVLREFSPNGAAFAYTLEAGDALYGQLDPYVLVQMNPPRPPVYTGTSPDLLGNRELLRQFLDIMGFESGGGTAYETQEGLAISEGGDRLRVSREGHVLYHAGEESRYPVASQGELPTGQEAALAAWELVNRAVSGWKGEGSFVLTGVEPAENGWLITLHVRLNGTPVVMSDTDWAAQVRVEGGTITDFTIHLRTYTLRDTVTPVPRERLAAAALPSLDGEGGRLLLSYIDDHTDTVTAGWVAEFP